jgi:hypothetical protein
MNEYCALLSQLGLWGWIFSVIYLINLSFPRKDVLSIRMFLKCGSISLIMFILWIAGMVMS